MIDINDTKCRILKLAFNGNLTTPNSNDDNVLDLLNKIGSGNKIIQSSELPFSIPSHWVWVKLKDLYKLNPKVEASDDTLSAFIPMEKISPGFNRSFSYKKTIWKEASHNHTKFCDGDVAFAKIQPCFENRKSFIAENLPNSIGGGTTELIILRQKEMYPLYTYYILNDQRFINEGVSSYKGKVGQQRVDSEVIKNYLVPVPPYAEQKRIATRIEEIFKLLDIIDEAQKKYSDDVEILKSKLITMGIQGKLTEQLESDGTADELYQQIQNEKKELIKEGKIKKEKALPEIKDEEIPFEIPSNWKWVRLAKIVSSLGDGLHGTPEYCENGEYYFINGNNLCNKKIVIKSDTKRVDKNEFLKYKKELTLGTVLVSINGTLGNIAFYNNERIILGKSACYFNLIEPEMKSFIYYILKTDYYLKYAHFSATGVTIKNVSLKAMNELLIPLPPLAEQKRIAEKLDDILKIIDKQKTE